MRFTLNGLLRLGIGFVLVGYGAFFWIKLQSAWKPSGDKGERSQIKEGIANKVTKPERRPFYERRKRLEQICSNGTFESPWDSQDFIVDTKHNVAYCDVSKTGSTFWKAIFAILTGKVNVTSPTHLMREHADQLHKINFTRFRSLSPLKQRTMITDGKFMLFARDPYMRLISAYMDKFVRPNAFYWREYGRVIINFIRQKKNERSRRCGHDLTFGEFIRFFVISQSPGKTFSTLDLHWTPIYQLCDPCSFPYNFIGKTEFMAEDTTEILKAIELNDAIDFNKSTTPSVEDDIKRRVTQFCDEYLKVQNCTNLLQLAERLWLYLAAKGYFKPAIALPSTLTDILNNSSSIDLFKHMLYAEALATYKEDQFPGSVDIYRLNFASGLFSQVSDDQLIKVKKIVKKDCVLFGYNNRPGYIFSNRNFTSNST